MAGSIRTCPACKTLLLRDTVQCPECDHVFDEARHRQMADRSENAAGATSPETQQEQCPSCHEMVRHGLVRCWNCGSFMREEIGELYVKMQAKPAPVIYSKNPGEEIYTVEEAGDEMITDEPPAARPEDDFELADDVRVPPSSPPPAASPASEADTYSLTAKSQPAAGADGTGTSEKQAAESAAPEETPDTPAADPESTAAQEPTPPANGDSATSGQDPSPDNQSNGDTEQPHSIATGGDALLQIAMEEELELGKRRRQPRRKQGKDRTISGFLVFCPNGHRIEVQDRHRGKAGRCPKCKSLFIVPEQAPAAGKPAEVEQAGGEAAEPAVDPNAAGAYTHWMNDVPMHTVNPEKLRLKPGSLEKEFQKVDLGFSPENILVATLPAAKGFLGLPGGGKSDEARQALLTSLREETPLDDIPVAAKRLVPADALSQLGIDQPVVYEHESMFVGVPVFGAGRIAVRLPKGEPKDPPTFLSFDLSGFREFSRTLNELYGIEDFGTMNDVPLTDEFTEVACHYSEEKFRVLENVEFYQNDSQSQLKLVGRKCQGCGLVVSEDSRKKEKIGGAKGSGIAKAKCPKCKAKFGDISLFDLETPPEPEPDEMADEKPQTADASA